MCPYSLACKAFSCSFWFHYSIPSGCYTSVRTPVFATHRYGILCYLNCGNHYDDRWAARARAGPAPAVWPWQRYPASANRVSSEEHAEHVRRT